MTRDRHQCPQVRVLDVSTQVLREKEQESNRIKRDLGTFNPGSSPLGKIKEGLT